ncbi:RNA binding methyltransferase FtsJ like [Halalkalibacter hemicellulosilyticusJCM 9152]|uniref:RNA binding methyltransferase FtsJ like n=1 Tax=Halalkalibacter hemicellulosilyticusJCM 9152 TaxID=1236971 RepID=W4QIG1_9BACI|nr:RNA binding methyltransferase FtsJ like [Halalkalibacter hemicellulosilyticusJCM 9152]
MERTNFRYVERADLQKGLPQFACMDVSFISIKLILPVLKSLLLPGSDVVALIKPQFEAGREQVGKKGIIRDPSIHEDVVKRMIDFALGQGYSVLGLDYSPIKGGEGNIEFLLHLQLEEEMSNVHLRDQISVEEVVERAHEQLKSL